MMRSLNILFSVLTAAALFSGCGGKKTGTMPPELTPLAQQFKTMADGDAKIEQGKKIMTLLPTCTRPGENGSLATIDFSNPTYVLKVGELQSLLGQPAEVTQDFISYKLGEKTPVKDEKRDGKHAKMKPATLYLLVEIYDDYVSSVRIDAGK